MGYRREEELKQFCTLIDAGGEDSYVCLNPPVEEKATMRPLPCLFLLLSFLL